jgi:hypothetical protein
MYGDGVHCLRDPKGRLWPSPWANSEDGAWANLTPEFHEWEGAKVKLLRWLAADDARWGRFVQVLLSEGDHWEMGWSRFLVTLTPAQVAEAAEKALRGMETAKPGNGGE